MMNLKKFNKSDDPDMKDWWTIDGAGFCLLNCIVHVNKTITYNRKKTQPKKQMKSDDADMKDP